MGGQTKSMCAVGMCDTETMHAEGGGGRQGECVVGMCERDHALVWAGGGGGGQTKRVCVVGMCEREMLHGSEGEGEEICFYCTLNHDGYIRGPQWRVGGGGVCCS